VVKAALLLQCVCFSSSCNVQAPQGQIQPSRGTISAIRLVTRYSSMTQYKVPPPCTCYPSSMPRSECLSQHTARRFNSSPISLLRSTAACTICCIYAIGPALPTCSRIGTPPFRHSPCTVHSLPYLIPYPSTSSFQAELQSGAFSSLTPVEALYLLDPHSLKRVAANFAARALSFVDGAFAHPRLLPSLATGTRLKMAYLGGGFREHPDGKNMQAVFSIHSRVRSHVHIFSLKRDSASDTQRYISQAVETWVDVSDLKNSEAAAAINARGIHVLLDVSGFTGEGVREQRCVILAHTPAPVQVNFLAWVATSGAPYMQHIVTDAVASPPEMALLYSEKLLLMPFSYFPSSIAWRHRRADLPPPQPAKDHVKALRLSLKLPGPPIMSAFNQLWKIDADLWGCICRVLLRVPNATLWLQEFPEAARNNLLTAALAMGLSPSRFHWTPLYAEEQHFLVKSLSNVQLDTLSYNGHTSLADVLWAGVPSVTLPMEKQSARVGALP
jgi:protein O-GlcNAc transferase